VEVERTKKKRSHLIYTYGGRLDGIVTAVTDCMPGMKLHVLLWSFVSTNSDVSMNPRPLLRPLILAQTRPLLSRGRGIRDDTLLWFLKTLSEQTFEY
jgi:hypothetical protein